MNMNEEKIKIWKEAFVAYLRVLFWHFSIIKGKNIKLSLCLLIKHQATRTYVGVEVQLCVFLTSLLKGSE
jgi:hypothetical protein